MTDWAFRELREVSRDVLPANKRLITKHMKEAAPVDTGELRRTITTRNDRKGRASVSALFYGAIQDAKGPNKDWIERGMDAAVDAINGR